MINPLFLPQNAKRRKKSTIEDNPQNSSLRRQFKLIHQLDCIYQGQVNNSYQKEGFGMQQTSDFHTYIGFWKTNKIHGIGMVVYPEGGLIYGNFKDNQIFGLALTDNKKRLRVGIFENSKIAGIGFQYNYADTKWKFCRFHKGVSIETINQAVSPIEKGPPSMMNLHEDMYILLSKYLNQQFFDIPVKSLVQRPYRSYTQMNVHKIDANYIYFGQAIDGKYWGLGMIYEKVSGYPIQIGYYETGELNGYGFKYDKDKHQIQMGLYAKGKKEGFFFEKRNRLQTIVEYQQNYCKGESLEMTRQKLSTFSFILETTQKIYNYQKNDYFSEKNKINFKGLRILLESDKSQLSKISQNLKNLTPKGDKKTGEKSEKAVSPKSDKKTGKYLANQINVSKSTVQVIREKLGDIQNIIKRSKAIIKDERQKKQQKKQPYKQPQFLQINDALNKIDLQYKGVEDGEVYEEEPPVSNNYNISDFYKENKARDSSSRNRSPMTARKLRSPLRIPQNNTTGRRGNSPETNERQNGGKSSYFYQPKTSGFELSPKGKQRSFSASKKKKRRIFE